MIEFSYFWHFRDRIPDRCVSEDWYSFVSILKKLSDVVGYKPSSDDLENKQALISPAIYANDGDTRKNSNVIGWDIVVLDIDDTKLSLEEIEEKFKLFNFVAYSSASCTYDKLKLRVIIPLSHRAPKERLSQLWFAVQKWSGGLVDEQTKDLSRMSYIPARYTNKGSDYRHFFLVNEGIDLPWDKLIAKYPSPPPEEKFKRDNPLKNLKRKLFMSNNQIPDMNIRSDKNPLVNERMIKEYLLTPAGGHHKAIYIFMVNICRNAERINYPIIIDEIVDMARQLDQLDGGYYDDKKLYGSAQDAMEFVGV